MLTSERYAEPEPEYLKYTGYPPLRERSDLDAVWAGLRDNVLDTVGSDHAAWTVEQKQRSSHDLNQLPVGLPGIEVQTRAIFSEGVSKGAIARGEVIARDAQPVAGVQPGRGQLLRRFHFGS